jgi:putative glutamine amidotransferase
VTAHADPPRELTDRALLDHAFAAGKPVLAICYGIQLLNVHLGGTLIQDIQSELPEHLQHEKDKSSGETRDPEHAVRLEGGSRLAALAGAADARVNSSHHQSIRDAGRGLRVTAHAPDGVIEAVEWTGDANWVVGVQWHPERMDGDAFAAALFRDLVAATAARIAAAKH